MIITGVWTARKPRSGFLQKKKTDFLILDKSHTYELTETMSQNIRPIKVTARKLSHYGEVSHNAKEKVGTKPYPIKVFLCFFILLRVKKYMKLDEWGG